MPDSGASATLDRLDDQIRWYDRRSATTQRWFKGLRLAEIAIALSLPVLALADANRMVLAAAGAAVVFASAYESINQYHSNWIAYRSTAEELKHEKYLHLAKAGPYASAENADKLLAERLEGLVSQEHAKWVSNAQEHGRGSNR